MKLFDLIKTLWECLQKALPKPIPTVPVLFTCNTCKTKYTAFNSVNITKSANGDCCICDQLNRSKSL